MQSFDYELIRSKLHSLRIRSRQDESNSSVVPCQKLNKLDRDDFALLMLLGFSSSIVKFKKFTLQMAKGEGVLTEF